MQNFTKKTRIAPGETVTMEIGYSEAAMHLQVAGTVMQVQLTCIGQTAMAQLFEHGKPYSFPITAGEAGFYQDPDGYYYYPPNYYYYLPK